jgi:predicted NBD/HSP70 family sugar kinase
MISIALVDYAGGVRARVEAPFDSRDPAVFAGTVRAHMKELADRHRLLGSRLLGVGVGIPGFTLTSDGERWFPVESLSDWRDVPLRQIFEDELGVPVWLDNDANAAALAEYYLGGTRSYHSDIVVILVGHGIGAGIITEGKVLKGQFGNAGEIGALYPVDQPRPSTVDLLAALHEQNCPIDTIVNFEILTRGHRDVIDRWVRRASKQLELFVNGAVVWLDPGAIVLSSALPSELLSRLAAHLNAVKIVEPRRPQVREVTVSSLGGAATTLGAALLPIHASVSL